MLYTHIAQLMTHTTNVYIADVYKPRERRKEYMKIKLNSDDDLSFNQQLKFINLTNIVRNVSEEHGKYYRQIFLD